MTREQKQKAMWEAAIISELNVTKTAKVLVIASDKKA